MPELQGIDGDLIMDRAKLKERLAGGVLLGALMLTLVWLILYARARRAWEPFELTSRDFKSFTLSIEGMQTRAIPVRESPNEPNIVGYHCVAHRGDAYVRLVHGYSMVDCMRIKGYEVALLQDTRAAMAEGGAGDASGWPAGLQVWRLKAPGGERSVWVTSILDAETFAATPVDVRAMLFPKVGVPDAVGYSPKGLTLDSLGDPIGNFRTFVQAEWNKSRQDVWTFLKLKQPAWASRRMLTLVSRSGVGDVSPRLQGETLQRVVRVHVAAARQLHAWRRASVD